MGSMKENAIREYLAGYDFKNEGWSVREIEDDMRKFLGEAPGIDIEYKKDVLINEKEGTAKEYKRLEKIKVVFTDLDDKYKKLEFLID
jgi:hypothetical protein